MNKSILKKFAIESKQDLTEKIRTKIKSYYVNEDFTNEQKGDIYILSNEKHSLSLTNEEYKKRELLKTRINNLSEEQVVEEATYTWFNRLIAIRYMELNDMLPLTRDNQSLGIRVLSSKDNTPSPEILKTTALMDSSLDINFNLDEYGSKKTDNERFKYVLLLICKKLGKVIPQVFDGITDYIDILIPDNLLNVTGFVAKLINEVPIENFSQVEIIGWLYQYYNQTEKDKVISAKKTYKKTEIPYATQLFTPDWIVKYMVENSLGKYWVEHSGDGGLYPSNNLCPSSSITDNWKYFIKDNLEHSNDKLNPAEITFIDPCCGSGHILVYAFEVFYQIYQSLAYNKKDIPELILKNNLYGLDIDDRAGQLSILSVLLKAREYDKNIFNKDIVCNLNIMSIQEPISKIDYSIMNLLSESKDKLKYLMDTFKNAKEIGSLLIVEDNDYRILVDEVNNDNTIFSIELKQTLLPLIKQAKILAKKYDVVVTNPPYMNNSVMGSNLKSYIQEHYKDVKSDLFSAFIIKNSIFGKKDSYLGFMTPYVWMFISSYEQLRNYIINNISISSLIQLEYSALEEATVPICSFVLNNKSNNNDGIFFRLSDFAGGMKVQEKSFLEILRGKDKKNLFHRNSSEFSQIPGNPIAYWISEKFINVFKLGESLGSIASVKQGLATADNNRFLRQWYEVDINNTLLNSSSVEMSKLSSVKWYPYNKGGEFRKWYGNNDYVVNWKNDGMEIKKFKDDKGKLKSRPQNLEYYFRESTSWSLISSSNIAFRYKPFGHIFDVAGMSYFTVTDKLRYLLALSNTNIVQYIMRFIAPTLNYQVGDIAKIPVIYDKTQKAVIDEIVDKNITISKEDWDSFEISWDFMCHPLILNSNILPDKIKEERNGFICGETIQQSFKHWEQICNERFNTLKNNEQEINKIFNSIYDLGEEITDKVDDKYITIRKADKLREIKSLISYAVGCMFGRYSLDEKGIIYAGGNFNTDNYKMFSADKDNIIPITDDAYFNDDIVSRFKEFIRVVYGNDSVNENLNYIAETLGKRNLETSEDTIRRYFNDEFYNDHIKIYQKRPIYWLFDSGKKNGFKCLIYMHRYNDNLIPKVRLDYLHRIQNTYEKMINDINEKLRNELSLNDKKEAQKRLANLSNKLQETKEYDEKIAHLANQRISVDLDDGVIVNYAKFQDILAKIR